MGRFVLPWFGGSAAAWSACLLFFQVGLLVGYAYAHGVARWLPPRGQAWADLGLVAITLPLLPIIPSDAWRPSEAASPVARLLLVLTLTVGLPYVVVASTSPLLQHWRAWSSGRSPYRLFALSNAAALLGLVSYPLLSEPAWGVRTQAVVWSVLYGAFVATRGWCAVQVIRAGAVSAPTVEAAPGTRSGLAVMALWLVLPAAGSAMLLATTNQLTQEVASVPFLWVLTLALYLLSFVICFDHERWYDRRVFAPLLALMVPLVIVAQVLGAQAPYWFELVVYGATLFVACMVCHGELVRAKPAPRYLTGFYLAVALGGAVGGAAVALVAPLVFRGFWEFPIALVACCFLALIVPTMLPGRPAPTFRDLMRSFVVVVLGLVVSFIVAARTGLTDAWRDGPAYSRLLLLAAGAFVVSLILDGNRARRQEAPQWYQYGLATGVLALAVAVVLLMAEFQRASIHTERNFYGVLRVRESQERGLGPFRQLDHGLTQHGIQFAAAGMRYWPTAYYGSGSGVGLALRRHPQRAEGNGSALRVGVVGLGVGTLATYGQPGDVFRFYELDPAVVRLAAEYFTYLDDSAAEITVVVGDARLQLEDELARGSPQRFDLLAVDAFLGDAVPVHLLTREAVAVYRAHLRAAGLLAIHVSNRLLDFRPLMDALAAEFGLAAVEIHSPGSLADGTRDATWVILGDRANVFFADPEVARAVAATARERRGERRRAPRLWTDDYSSLWPLLRGR